MIEKIIAGVFCFVFVVGLIIGGMYLFRSFNAATLHNQVITPKEGIECVVVSATDSISVDCWKI